MVARLDQFREVVLDFAGVETIGPAFADEVFRVFWSRHSCMMLIPVNTNEDVQRMIMRSLRAGREAGTQESDGWHSRAAVAEKWAAWVAEIARLRAAGWEASAVTHAPRPSRSQPGQPSPDLRAVVEPFMERAERSGSIAPRWRAGARCA